MNVLIIPEDFRKDQYILKPIVRAMLAHLGRPRAKVEVLRDPLLQGIDQAMDWEQIQQIVRDRRMVDLFLLCVDRDGNETRRVRLDALEERSAALFEGSRALLGENAWQEVEVWVLAGHTLPADWNWQEVRQERDPKERYFEPYARSRGAHLQLSGGRKTLGEEAARRYDRVRQLCPEDIQALEARIAGWLQEQASP